MFTRLLNHIRRYYITPRKGHPPWWVHLGVFATALVLWFVVWQPIKVYHTEPMSFSEAKGDRIEIIEKTGYVNRHTTSSWMKIRFNLNTYWCNCYFDSCTFGRLPTGQIDTLKGADILVVNQKYCLVTSVAQLKNGHGDLTIKKLTPEVIKKRLSDMGGYYFYHRIILLIFIFFYINRIYLFDYEKWKLDK